MKNFDIRLEINDNSGTEWYNFTWDSKPMRLREKFTTLVLEAVSEEQCIDRVLELSKGTVKILSIKESNVEENNALKDMIMFNVPKPTKEVLQRTLSNPIGISNN